MREQWKTIDGWPYEASSMGRVRNSRTGYILKPCDDKYGYFLVTLCDSGNQVTRTVHRLVSRTFLGGKPDGYVVNHMDGRKHNNGADNLEYVTPAENERHAVDMGLKARGERNNKAKLTEDDVRSIRDLYKGGLTQVELGKMYGMSHRGIGHVVNRKNWKHVA